MKTKFALSALLAGLVALPLLASPAAASGDAEHPPAQKWSFTGPFGTYDRATAQRGYQVYKEVCAACHSMRLVAFRNLRDLGFSEAEVKALAAQYDVVDGPNDSGDMFERKGLPSDRFKSPFPNEKAARAANGGAYPLDLSLIAKARGNGTEGAGPDYIAAVLSGYAPAPAGVTLGEGLHYNKYFPGNQIAMPQPLSEGQVTYADGTKASVEQMAFDVSTFLMWAAEPKLEARKNIGFKAIAFLVLLSILLFAAKRRVWANIGH